MRSDHARALWPGVPLALGSAILFGLSTPLSKLLLGSIAPQMLAGLLYLGAGLGLFAAHAVRAKLGIGAPEAPLRKREWPWLAAVALIGGGVAPVLMMLGLAGTDAATGSLMLNVEGLATLGIAWLVFREHVDARLFTGAVAILAGAVILTWDGGSVSLDAGALLIALACLAWGVDNNLTRKLSSADPVQIAMFKGLAAGAVNVVIAVSLGAPPPAADLALAAGFVGLLGVGVSLVMFVLAMRHLGVARTGAYFSLAPFIGALASLALPGETVSAKLFVAGALMAVGLYLHLAERHDHEHEHEAMEHEHRHIHDEHHQHAHDGPTTEPHSHRHRHEPMRHSHPHYPDLHHRHRH